MKPDLASHPYFLIRQLIDTVRSVDSFEFSYYHYRPQSVIDERRVFSIVARTLNEELVFDLMKQTPHDMELALHSRVQVAGKIWHLPMIDMSTSARAHLEKLRATLSARIFESLVWFKSGRSFHGYSLVLLSEREWIQFMGGLLLCNLPKMHPTVDPRWIGHRLVAGYSALRWTRNTTQYLQFPTRVKE